MKEKNMLRGRFTRCLSSQHARLGLAVIIGVGGAALVFQLLDWMNGATSPPEKIAAKGPVDFLVEPRKAPKKIQRRPRPPRQARPRATPRAPLPNLTTALSDVDFGIQPLADDVLAGAQDDLLGAEASLRDVVMTASAVDEPPRISQRIQPRYPPRARAEGITGYVRLRLLVGQDGQVVEARVVEATPVGIFEDSALSAIRQCVFNPATYRGKRVKMWAEQVMRFNLG